MRKSYTKKAFPKYNARYSGLATNFLLTFTVTSIGILVLKAEVRINRKQNEACYQLSLLPTPHSFCRHRLVACQGSTVTMKDARPSAGNL